MHLFQGDYIIDEGDYEADVIEFTTKKSSREVSGSREDDKFNEIQKNSLPFNIANFWAKKYYHD